jgi:hypothetical protein
VYPVVSAHKDLYLEKNNYPPFMCTHSNT